VTGEEIPDWYRPTLEATDVDTLLAIAKHHLTLNQSRQQWYPPESTSDLSFAQAWYRRAFEIDPSTAWQTAQDHMKVMLGRQAAGWQRYAIEGEYPAEARLSIDVSPRCFPIYFDKANGYPRHQGWEVQVVTEQVDAATAALEAAARRVRLVDSLGAEHASDDHLDTLYGQGVPSGEVFTPSGVHASARPAGPMLRIRHGDAVLPLAARTVLRVLVDELTAAGVTKATIAHPDDVHIAPRSPGAAVS
jgi:hypothetical protein